MKPKFDDILTDAFVSVDRDSVFDRYGVYISETFQRLSDNTFWMVQHTGYANGEIKIRAEHNSKIIRVYPKRKTIIVYKPRGKKV